MKRYLILKLLAVHLVVIGFVVVIVWLAIDTLAAGYFVTLMEKYNISPEPAHAMFVDAVHRYLLWASLAAVILAVALSFVMMRRVLSPLSRMTVITREIAAGNFDVRVPVGSRDEIGQLARAFNRMAQSLEEIESLRRTLMIDVAHELRTPLTNMRGYLEALEDGVLPASSETIRLLRDETLRLAQLVEDVLQLARADAARRNLEAAALDLCGLVRETLETLSPDFARKSLTVNLRAPGHPGGGARRPPPPDPGAAQPGRQCRPLQPRRRRGRGGHRSRGAPGAARNPQHRPRTGGPGPALHLRALLPGREIALPQARRRRHRTGHRQGTRRSPRRPGHRSPGG